MELIEAVKLALQSLWANKMRSILTLLGVVIGVASVIMVVTLTNGAKVFVTTKINTYGADVITVSKMPQTFITLDEYLSFQKRETSRSTTTEPFFRLPLLRFGRRAARLHGKRRVRKPLQHRHQHSRAGPGPCPRISNLNIALGRSFTDVEDAHSAHVAIVGSDVVDNLLGPGDPLGKEIRVDGVPYTVIGVAKPQGKMLGQSMDNWVAIPLTAFCKSMARTTACRSTWTRAAAAR